MASDNKDDHPLKLPLVSGEELEVTLPPDFSDLDIWDDNEAPPLAGLGNLSDMLEARPALRSTLETLSGSEVRVPRPTRRRGGASDDPEEEETRPGRAIPVAITPHFEIGVPSGDMEDETMQLDISALRLGLEIPAQGDRPRSRPTEPYKGEALQVVVQEASRSSSPARPAPKGLSSLGKRFDADRTMEADLSALSRGMMQVEHTRPTAEVDVRVLAQRLNQEIMVRRDAKSAPAVSKEVNDLALNLATEVVTRRVTDNQETTIKGDMGQLAREIAERIAAINATQELDVPTRSAMTELAFELAAQLESEALDLALGVEFEAPSPQTTLEVDPEDLLLAADAARGDLDGDRKGMGDDDSPLPWDAPAVERGRHALPPLEAIEAWPHIVELDVSATIETGPGEAVQEVIARALADSAAHLPPQEQEPLDAPLFPPTAPFDPSRPLTSTAPEARISTPAQPRVQRKKSSRSNYMLISLMLIFIVVALGTVAVLVYFFK